ncbi:putative Oxalocrotonate tautomerase [Seiridium cardinale]
MPVWHILHSDDVFTDMRERASLVKDITALYTSGGLPPFYVNIFFHKLAPGDFWTDSRYQGDLGEAFEGDVAGVKKRERPFVHFEVDQIAVHFTDEAWARQWCEKLNKALKPYTADKGYDWEYHIDETPRSLWRINGLVAPPWKSAVERKWFEENKPTSWEEKVDEDPVPKQV